ncbi:DUF1847 domain-containing protein [Clostridia bacterium OttesenSCG-928-F22]|nr:DUF1847 domain-containing protein [Clostridia bacterium OttesenSCG-928-F22]
MDGKCAQCGLSNRICQKVGGASPEFCSTTIYEDTLKEAFEKYSDAETHHFAQVAARQEQSCYAPCEENPPFTIPQKTRIQVIMEFCQKMNYKRIGFAFCGGLHKEANMVAPIFESHGLEVVSAMCKVGGLDKTCLGLSEEDKVHPNNHESMCNPIGQAMILNEAGTQFNVIMGLCVGHDSLFLKNSDALCTVLAVKDRVTGHNPLAALYTSHSYYRYLKQKKD